jgi:hypothetical protein
MNHHSVQHLPEKYLAILKLLTASLSHARAEETDKGGEDRYAVRRV